jgi:hypothetical protein
MAYIPCANQAVEIDVSALQAKAVSGWWFDPRTGLAQPAAAVKAEGWQRFTTPIHGGDWVLVLDDSARGARPPGLLP